MLETAGKNKQARMKKYAFALALNSFRLLKVYFTLFPPEAFVESFMQPSVIIYMIFIVLYIIQLKPRDYLFSFLKMM